MNKAKRSNVEATLRKNSIRVMLDTNVALDLLQDRKPFVYDALQIFALAEEGRLRLLLSTDAISTIFYVVSKNSGVKAGREAIAKLLDYVTLVALDEKSVIKGLSLDFEDVEDALVAAVAQKENAKVIVTRNAADFVKSPVVAITPREFIASFETKNRSLKS